MLDDHFYDDTKLKDDDRIGIEKRRFCHRSNCAGPDVSHHSHQVPTRGAQEEDGNRHFSFSDFTNVNNQKPTNTTMFLCPLHLDFCTTIIEDPGPFFASITPFASSLFAFAPLYSLESLHSPVC
jgi:hypothetical protein